MCVCSQVWGSGECVCTCTWGGNKVNETIFYSFIDVVLSSGMRSLPLNQLHCSVLSYTWNNVMVIFTSIICVFVCYCFVLSLGNGGYGCWIYGFMASCMKGQRGESERFTLSLFMSVYVASPLVGQRGQSMTGVHRDPIVFRPQCTL